MGTQEGDNSHVRGSLSYPRFHFVPHSLMNRLTNDGFTPLGVSCYSLYL